MARASSGGRMGTRVRVDWGGRGAGGGGSEACTSTAEPRRGAYGYGYGAVVMDTEGLDGFLCPLLISFLAHGGLGGVGGGKLFDRVVRELRQHYSVTSPCGRWNIPSRMIQHCMSHLEHNHASSHNHTRASTSGNPHACHSVPTNHPVIYIHLAPLLPPIHRRAPRWLKASALPVRLPEGGNRTSLDPSLSLETPSLFPSSRRQSHFSRFPVPLSDTHCRQSY